MEEKEQQTGEATPPEINIPWFRLWEHEEQTPPDPDFVTRLVNIFTKALPTSALKFFHSKKREQ